MVFNPSAKPMTVGETRKLPVIGERGRSGGLLGHWWDNTQVQVWLDALYVWGVTRALLLALTYLAPALFGTSSTGHPAGGLIAPLRNWFAQDAVHFIYIAQHGYDQAWRTAFFPLFPLLEHILAPFFGGDYGLAGMFVANASYLGALVVLRDLVGRDFEPDVARRTLLYLSIFPTAFYFFAPYSEPLWLLLAIGSFAATRRRRWWLAGVLGGFAMLTRSQSLVLLVPFAIEFVAARRYGLVRWWEALWAALIPAGLGVYSFYLYERFHDPFAYSTGQGYWQRGLAWPWQSIVASIIALASGSQQNSVVISHLALNLGATLVFLVLTVPALRKLPPSYGLFAAATIVYFLTFPVHYDAVASQGDGRFVAVIFPIFVLVAHWGRNPRLHEALIIGGVGLLTLFSLHFLFHGTWGQGVLWG